MSSHWYNVLKSSKDLCRWHDTIFAVSPKSLAYFVHKVMCDWPACVYNSTAWKWNRKIIATLYELNSLMTIMSHILPAIITILSSLGVPLTHFFTSIHFVVQFLFSFYYKQSYFSSSFLLRYKFYGDYLLFCRERCRNCRKTILYILRNL